jgi:YVTN family beta-propeller protein
MRLVLNDSVATALPFGSRGQIRSPVRALLTASALLAVMTGCKVAPDSFSDPVAPCPSVDVAVQAFDRKEFHSVPAPTPRKPATTKPQQPWQSGHPLALSGSNLLVVDEANGTLVQLNAQTLTVSATWPVGERPFQVVTKDDRAYVSLRGGSEIADVNLLTGTVQLVHVGVEPTGLALNADGSRLVVAVAGPQQLVVLDPATHAELLRTAIGARPTAVAFTTSGQLVVVHQSASMEVFQQDEGGAIALWTDSLALAVSPLANAGDALGGNPTRAVIAAADPQTGNVAVAHVVVHPGDPQASIAATLDAITPAGTDCNAQGSGGGGGYGSGSGNSFFNSNNAVPPPPAQPALTLVRFNKASPTTATWGAASGFVTPTVLDGRSLLDQIDQPSDIAFHPTLQVAAVVGTGSDNVVFLDTVSNRAIAVAQLPDFSAPRAIVMAPDGSTAWVLEGNTLRIARLDLVPLTQRQGSGAPIAVAIAAESAPFALDPLPKTARLGRQVFFNATNPRVSAQGHFACATCHLNGEDDQQVWFVADGPRQTPILAGRLKGTGPFNWEGSQVVLQNNMVDTVHRMGGEGLTAEELASLEQFLLVGLPAPLNPNVNGGTLTAVQARGKELFQDAKVACASCHTPGPGTDGLDQDIGTATDTDAQTASLRGAAQVGQFNTPSLAGLYRSAPYFHDGSAATLDQVMQRTSDLGKMGDTSGLTPADRDALTAYLLTL